MIAAVMLSFALVSAPECAVERAWIKNLSDRAARKIDLDPIPMTVEELTSMTLPRRWRPKMRRDLVEKFVYEVTADVIGYKLEADSDYHVVVQGASGATMIIEIVDPKCTKKKTTEVFQSQIETVRFQFAYMIGEPVSAKYIEIAIPRRLKITGVGFWDKPRGQKGAAPNGIELHPVLSLQVCDDCSLREATPGTDQQWVPRPPDPPVP